MKGHGIYSQETKWSHCCVLVVGDTLTCTPVFEFKELQLSCLLRRCAEVSACSTAPPLFTPVPLHACTCTLAPLELYWSGRVCSHLYIYATCAQQNGCQEVDDSFPRCPERAPQFQEVPRRRYQCLHHSNIRCSPGLCVA